MALTKSKVDAAKYKGDGKAWDLRYDGAVPGFGVRIFPSGTKSFVLRYRTKHGRTRLATIGRYGVLTLDQARIRAKRMLVEVTDGKDPVEERRREKTSTLREFAPEYLEYVKAHNKSWKEDARRLGFREERGRIVPNEARPGRILPALGSRPMTEIRRADVERLHSKIGKSAPIEANRTVALLSAMFSRGLPEGTPNPAAVRTSTRKDGIRLFPEHARTRYVKQAELPRLIKAIEKEEDVFIRAVVWLALLTSCRKTELLSRKWADVDFDRRELRLPDTKSGREHVVPLSDAAMEILEELPRFSDNDHIFPGARRGQPLKDISKPWRRIRSRAKLEDVRFHDVRRTVGSMMANSGASLLLIGRVMNHSNPSVTAKHYAHITDSAPRTALEAHAADVLRVVQGGKS